MSNNTKKTINGTKSSWLDSLMGRRHRPTRYRTPFRRLALQLHHDLPRTQGPRSAMIVSPTDSPLGSRGTVELAFCLGEELQRPVLLIDASTGGSATTALLDCGASRGCYHLLSGAPDADDLVLPTTRENVFFLPSGANGSGPLPASPERLQAMVSAAAKKYDFVLVAGGSVLDEPAALALAPGVGCVLLMAVENETRKDDLDAARDALVGCRARKLGLVFTSPVRGGGSTRPHVGVSSNRGADLHA